MHSFMRSPNILYFMCKYRLSLPPPRISQLSHKHKSLHNNSAGTLFSCSTHSFHASEKHRRQFHFAREECRADYGTRHLRVITELSEKARKVRVFLPNPTEPTGTRWKQLTANIHNCVHFLVGLPELVRDILVFLICVCVCAPQFEYKQ